MRPQHSEQVSAFRQLLARALILWPERIAKQKWPLTPREAQRLDFAGHLKKHFEREIAGLSLTDLDRMLESFLESENSLLAWHRILFERQLQGIDWRQGEPQLPMDGISEWVRLCNQFDPCSLLTLHWALGRRSGESHRRLPSWRTTPVASDMELRALWRRGLSDMHVHIGGVRLVPEAWLTLMERESALAPFEALAKAYATSGAALRHEVLTARRHRAALLNAAGMSGLGADLELDRGAWWTWSPARLDTERQMLAGAWLKLIRLEHAAAGDKASAAERDDLVRNLDMYLGRKHGFFALVRQPAFLNAPGLRQFDKRYFGVLKTKARGDRGPDSYKPNLRKRMIPIGNAFRYLTESPDLKRIELRMAPYSRAPDYLRFFKDWSQLKGQIDRRFREEAEQRGELPRQVDVRFAVHFKRSASARGVRANAAAQLDRLDRETAALRIALGRDHVAADILRSTLARIDVAGQERDTACDLYHFHLRLLRGDSEALGALEADEVPLRFAPHVKAWRNLVERNLHRAGTRERSLGLTIHAGEDFADKLDGLYQISSALDACQLRDGDGIGHALALAASAKADGPLQMLELGANLDSLCWLFSLLEDNWNGLENERSRIHQQIWRLQRQLSERAGLPLPSNASVEDFTNIWRMRCRHARATRDLTPIRRRLLRNESAPSMIRAREHAEPVGAERDFPGSITRAREQLLAEIIRRRVIIEMNPSSNLRISGAAQSSLNPTFEILAETKSGLLACINTDNPGVFGTCVENEYGLLLDAARESGTISERAIRDWLEAARRTGVELLA